MFLLHKSVRKSPKLHHPLLTQQHNIFSHYTSVNVYHKLFCTFYIFHRYIFFCIQFRSWGIRPTPEGRILLTQKFLGSLSGRLTYIIIQSNQSILCFLHVVFQCRAIVIIYTA